MQNEKPNISGKNLAQTGKCLAQGSSGGASINTYILLNLCYTISCANNDSIVSKFTVILSEEHLHIYSNGGHMYYTMRGTLDILPMDIYVNDKPMANIISLKEVAYSFHVTMYTK